MRLVRWVVIAWIVSFVPSASKNSPVVVIILYEHASISSHTIIFVASCCPVLLSSLRSHREHLSFLDVAPPSLSVHTCIHRYFGPKTILSCLNLQSCFFESSSVSLFHPFS